MAKHTEKSTTPDQGSATHGSGATWGSLASFKWLSMGLTKDDTETMNFFGNLKKSFDISSTKVCIIPCVGERLGTFP